MQRDPLERVGIRAALALGLTPLVGRASALLGLVDAPGGRKVHTHSIPRTGGLAVVAAAVLALATGFLFLPEMHVPNAWAALRPLVLSGAIIFLLGLLDDVYGLGAGVKLAVELANGGQRYAPENPYIYHSAACAYAAIGQIDNALVQVQRAIEHEYEHTEKMETDADLSPLQSDPRFPALFNEWRTRRADLN